MSQRRSRTGKVERKTKETEIAVSVDLDGSGRSEISTGIGFLDHMLDQLSRHALIDLTVKAKGDLHIDFHHTTEDTGICIGEAVAKALGERTGIRRWGEATVPISGAWACCFLVSACAAVRDYERAFEWCDRIAEFAKRYGSRYMLAFCRAEYGAVHLSRGWWAEAEKLLQASVGQTFQTYNRNWNSLGFIYNPIRFQLYLGD